MTIQHSSPWITAQDTQVIQKLLLSKMIADGHTTSKLINFFSTNLKLGSFYPTSSGSTALFCILKGLRLQANDEIILPTYVCPSVLFTIQKSGAIPILCDIEPYWLISASKVADKITKRTKAVIIPQLFGISIDLKPFRDLGIILISDLCQNFDAVYYQNNHDYGDAVFFSFHPTKCITAINGGGFSIINEKIDFDLRAIENYCIYTNFSDIHAALLLAQLNRYDQFTKKRKKIAHIYFENIPTELTQNIPTVNNSFYRYPLTQKRHDFIQLESFFLKNGVIVRRGVDNLLHRILKIPDNNFPNSIHSYNETLSIPIYPALSLANVKKISNLCKEI